MIGLDQEPSTEARDRLNSALGEGQYTVDYRETAAGVAIIVNTREVPSRVWSAQVARGVPRESVDAVWSDLSHRIAADALSARAEQQAVSGPPVVPDSNASAGADLSGPPIDEEPALLPRRDADAKEPPESARTAESVRDAERSRSLRDAELDRAARDTRIAESIQEAAELEARNKKGGK